MANPNPSHKTRFRLRNNANPRGAKAHDHKRKMIRSLTNAQLEELANIILNGNVKQLDEIESCPSSSVLKVMIASIVKRIIKKGDVHALEMLLNRLIGKPKVMSDSVTREQGKIIIKQPSNGREC